MSGRPTAPSLRRNALAARARDAFTDRFGTAPAIVAAAPGRVNLIGEHTDYNDGFVLPMAIDRSVMVACSAREDGVVRAHAAELDETCEFDIETLQVRPRAWEAYVAGVIWAFRRAGLQVAGADLAIVSDLPIGAGLSSSAALELATARALCAEASIAWDPKAMAGLARDAEHRFVGVACGIMDQFAAAVSAGGCALLLDCRSLHTEFVRIPTDAAIIVMDTSVRRSLAASAYNHRRAACDRAVAAARALDPAVTALRDVSEELLTRARHRMDDEAYARARHVVAEIARPRAMAERLAAGDLVVAGKLMNDSHASLRDLYEVSSTELDAIVSAAQSHPSCHGARLTGAGFGGCAVALVASDASGFMRDVSATYRRAVGADASLFVSQPAAGAELVA